jgi:hypothetical protein
MCIKFYKSNFKFTPAGVILIFFYLFTINTVANGQCFTTKKSQEGVEIMENGKKVLFYQVHPKSVDGKYVRSGFIHPLYSLNEKILTDDMPPDHPYHRGIFWAWHQIILNGKNIADGWTIEHISWNPIKMKVKKNEESVILQSQIIWNAEMDDNKKPMPIVREKTKIKVFRSTDQYRVVDFDIHLYALKDNLQIGGSDDPKGYGGFSLRLKLPKDLTFISGNKKVIPEETPVLAGPWMDFVGSFEGESLSKSGVIVFGYPSASVHKYPWILRNVTSMQNVPFPGRTAIPLSRRGLRLTYRIIIHKGEMRNADIEKLYEQYIDEPTEGLSN